METETEKTLRQTFNHDKYLKDVTINRNDLETELCTNPANLAYYIAQAAYWSGVVDTAKLLRDNRAASIYVDLKDSGSKVTDGYISAKQQLDDDYQKYARQLKVAREQLALYEGAVTALEKKQFSLGSLNAMNRVEFDATTSVIPTRSTPQVRADRRQAILDAQS